MKRRKALATLALAVSGLAVLPVAMGGKDYRHGEGAHKGHHGDYRHGYLGSEEMLEKMKEKLDLDEGQVAQIRAILQGLRTQLEPLKREKRANREILQAMVFKGTYDEAELERTAKAQGDLKAQMIMLRVKSRVEVMKVLNASQQEKYKEYFAQRKGYRHH